MWCAAKSGQFLTKMGYRVQSVLSEKCIWQHLCWNAHILPRAGAFAWLVKHYKVLSGDKLMRLGFYGLFWCPMCNDHEENMDHLFVTCSFASECWSYFMNKMKWYGPLHRNLQGVFESWPILHKDLVWTGLWCAILAQIIWHIWREINARIFRDKAGMIQCMINGIEIEICQHINVRVK